LTLYVESNFVLELALGQEELASAERLLAAAENRTITLALPSFSLSEPFVRVSRGIRDRGRLLSQMSSQVIQLARSAPHQPEVDVLLTIPDLFATIDRREKDRLVNTLSRILACAKVIELDSASFQSAMDYRTRYGLEVEDAIVLAAVVSDLQSRPGGGQHLFANRNRRDFDDIELAAELSRLGCDLVWSFVDAVRLLSVSPDANAPSGERRESARPPVLPLGYH
jgi:predicted nucleic acid-binding protein